MEKRKVEVVQEVTRIVRSRMAKLGAGHGFDHVQRVLNTSRLLQNKCGGDLLVIELSALLHDIGDAKFYEGEERSKEFAIEILLGLRVDQFVVDQVGKIVDNISFRKRDTAEVLSLEGQVVQDADRLDALGAIGIVRTIEFGAVFKQPFYLPGQVGSGKPQKTGVGHFHQKLFKLRALMNTEPAREMAKAREDFMRAFLRQFEVEWCSVEG